MLFRKIRYWFRWRKISRDRKKLYNLSPEEVRERIEGLFPDSESPLMELTKRLNTPGAIVPGPEFKMFGITKEDAEFIKFQEEIIESFMKGPRK